MKLRSLLRTFDAALVVACFLLAATAGVALAEETYTFLNKPEPPSGGGQGLNRYNTHVWGWADNGSACIHEYIEIAKAWTSPHCALLASEGVNDHPDTESKPGAWNDPNLFYGEHRTQGEQWWP